MLTVPTQEPILIAEDNPDDVFLLKRALRRNGAESNVYIVEDGQEAIDYLRREPPFDDRFKYPFPSVIYTDLKMPRVSGLEVIRWLKEHPDCGVIPVIVFSASQQDEDIKQAYQLGANAYLVKPTTLDQLTEMIRVTMEFWKMCQKPLTPAKC
jgi:CheY-like chemotaxis protein